MYVRNGDDDEDHGKAAQTDRKIDGYTEFGRSCCSCVAGGTALVVVVIVVVAASFVYLGSISYPDSTEILTEKFLKRLSYNTSLIMFTQESSSPPPLNSRRRPPKKQQRGRVSKKRALHSPSMRINYFPLD